MNFVNLLEHDGEIYRIGDTIEVVFDNGKKAKGKIKGYGVYGFCGDGKGVEEGIEFGKYLVPLTDIVQIKKCNTEKIIPCESDKDLLTRIADYFATVYKGNDKTAPQMALSVQDLRFIAGLHVEKCKWQAEATQLRKYKERMEMQFLDDIDNPLEPLKLQKALESELLKYEYRIKQKPNDVNILDFTVMASLKHCLEEQMGKEDDEK